MPNTHLQIGTDERRCNAIDRESPNPGASCPITIEDPSSELVSTSDVSLTNEGVIYIVLLGCGLRGVIIMELCFIILGCVVFELWGIV